MRQPVFFLMLFFAALTSAQAQSWLWAIGGGGGSYENGYGISANAAGDVFTNGRFAGTMSLGGQSITAGGATSIYCGRFDANGNASWLKSYAPSGGFDYAFGFHRDNNDNVYSTGTVNSGASAYLNKYNAAGVFEWAVQLSNANAAANGIATDNDGNVYVTGPFSGPMNFGVVTLNPVGSWDMFLAKYNSAGTCLWAVAAGGAGYDAPRGLAVDGAGNAIVCGGYTGSPTFGSITPPASTPYSNLFVAKYDPNGVVQWVTTAANAGIVNNGWWEENDVVTDACGNIFVAGHFQNTAQFGPLSVNSNGGDDAFVAKFLSNGNVEWVKAGGGSGSDQALSIALDHNYDVYISGSFQGNATFESNAVSSSGTSDVFVAKYANSTGDLQWVQNGGGTSDEYASGVTVDPSGFVYITGGYSGQAAFGPTLLPNAFNGDVFIAKLDTVPALQILASPDSIYCPGATAQLPYTVHGTFNPGNVFTAQLSDANGSFLNPVDLGVVTGTTGGDMAITIPANTPSGTGYIIRVTSSSPAYSSFDFCFRVTISNSFPVVTSNDTTVCSGAQVQLFASGGTDYAWSPSLDLSCATCDVTTATPTATTTYTVTVSNGTCTTEDSVIVAVSLSLAVQTGSDTAICSGTSATLSASGATVYSWTPSADLSCDDCPTPVASPTLSTTYTVTGSDAGCSGSDTIVVTVNAIPATPVIAATTPVCEGGDISFTTTSTGTFAWSGPNAFASSQQNPVVTNAALTHAGTYSLAVTENGCTSQDATIDVVVNELPVVDVTPDAVSVCIGTSAPLTGSGATTFSWQPAVGLSATNAAAVTASPDANTTYTVTGTNANGCSASATAVVSVTPLPTSTFDLTDSVCLTSTATALYNGNAAASAVFNWNFGAATVSGSGAGPYALSFPATGVFEIVLTVDESGCTSNPDTQTVVVTPSPTALFQIAPASVCLGDNVTVQYAGNAGAGATYNWNTGSAQVVSGAGQGPLVLNFELDGVQSISLSVAENGCASEVGTDSVIVHATPTVSFFAQDTTACETLVTQFVNASLGDAYSWSFGDGTYSTEESPTHQFSTGVYDVALTVTNAVGCSDSLLLESYINVVPNPVAAFASDPAANEPTQLTEATFEFTNQSTNAASYLWLFGDDSTSTALSPRHRYTAIGEFTVTLIAANALGCTDTATLSPLVVTGNNVIFIPNTFTPNNDGVNDLFTVLGVNVSDVVLEVYNRWGEQVFVSKGPENGWDGLYKGVPVNSGVYVYNATITMRDKTVVSKRGDINLLR